MIRAKMQVQSVTKLAGGDEIVKLSAVYGGSTNAEDNSFSKATPQASLEMYVSNPLAQGKLLPGRKYYLDFTEAAD